MGTAPSRLAVFEAVDGRRTAEEIARSLARHVNNVRRDLAVLRDAGLVHQRMNAGIEVTRDGYPIYEKVALARTVSLKYFGPVGQRPEVADAANKSWRAPRKDNSLPVPDENAILEVARHGEDQLYEFKMPGVEAGKLSREICAMLNTSRGGIVFYGIDDAGTIVGSDMSRQQFDQLIQNSIKNTISPAAVVGLHSVSVMGSEVLVVVVPPWNRKDVYQHGEKVLVRKGTNVFAAKPEELKKLYAGQSVI